MPTVATPSDNELLQRIERRLDEMLRLSALQTTSGLKQGPAIELLAGAGIDRNVIAGLLHTTPNTVSVTLSKYARKKRNE
jgi:hypothetical protein